MGFHAGGDEGELLILPEYFDYSGKRYRVIGVDESAGKLKYFIEDLNQVVEETYDQVVSRAVENGIFFGKSSVENNSNGSVLRSEFIFELWRLAGSPQVEAEETVGEEAYYKSAIKWFESKKNLSGIYNYRDLEGNITWFEVAYIIYNLYKSAYISKGMHYEDVELEDTRTSVVYTKSHDYTLMDENLASYKQEMWMKPYIESLANGKRYLPFPVFSAVDFLVRGFNLGLEDSQNTPKLVNGKLVVSQWGIGKYSWCVSEITRKQTEEVINTLSESSST